MFRLGTVAAVAVLVAGSGPCDDAKKIRRHFDAPVRVAIGPSGDASPAHTFGFVSDANHFALRRIDLTRRKLIEPRFPVGRALAGLATHTGPAGVVDRIWGVDRTEGELVSVDPASALLPTAGPVTFTDAGAASNVELVDLTVTPGRTGTQSWTVTYREGLDRWEVQATGSGTQKTNAKTDGGYESDEVEVKFAVRSTGGAPPTEGDRFSFDTDNGVEVFAVAGSAQVVNLVSVGPDVGVVSTVDPPVLAAFDLSTGLNLMSWSLAAGASPAGMESSPDGSALYVSDLGNPQVYRLNTVGAPAAWTLESFTVPVPSRDVAVTGDAARLFVMAADADDIFAFLLPAVTPIDFIGTEPGFDPLEFPSAIRAMSGARRPHVMKGSGVPAYPVFVTTHAGNVFVLNGATGCVDFSDSRGARFTGVRFRDAALPSAPKFGTETFATSRCGGIPRTETWTIAFNGVLDAWEVAGTASGKQLALLFEGVPYTSDRGELSIQINGDTDMPTDDGDTFFLSVGDGIAPTQVGLVPERPVFYTIGTGVDEVEYALVPNATSDTITQIEVARRRVVETYR